MCNSTEKVQGVGSTADRGLRGGEVRRPQLRDRIESRARSAQHEFERAQKSIRLLELLDKHPEIAEILDLVEYLGM